MDDDKIKDEDLIREQDNVRNSIEVCVVFQTITFLKNVLEFSEKGGFITRRHTDTVEYVKIGRIT